MYRSSRRLLSARASWYNADHTNVCWPLCANVYPFAHMWNDVLEAAAYMMALDIEQFAREARSLHVCEVDDFVRKKISVENAYYMKKDFHGAFLNMVSSAILVNSAEISSAARRLGLMCEELLYRAKTVTTTKTV